MRRCRTIVLTTFLLCLGEGLMAQDPVKGNVQGIHGGRLQVVSVLPDSFPSIGLVLRAEDSTGTPFWDLHRDQVRVTEDGAQCAVTCLYPITYPAPIHIALVIDHSGSMALDGSYMEDTTLLLEWMTDAAAYQRFLDTTESPLDHARNGVLCFIAGGDAGEGVFAAVGGDGARVAAVADAVAVDVQTDRGALQIAVGDGAGKGGLRGFVAPAAPASASSQNGGRKRRQGEQGWALKHR